MRVSHIPQSKYLVGWAINRMRWLRIDLRVMVSTSELFILESIVGAGRWQVCHQLKISTKTYYND